MDALKDSPIWGWKLETFYDKKGQRRHQRASGYEYWRSEELIGNGAFGGVWRERCVSGPSHNALRAVKHLHKRQVKMSKRELAALVTFSDPYTTEYKQYFVQFLGWFDDKNFFYIAMEYLEHGDLQQYIGIPLPEPQAISIVAQVAQALQYMHHRQFVHRDIKPQNILVSHRGPNWHVKVTDFGISKNTEGTALDTLNIGTHGYMAPELVYDEIYGDSKEYTPAVDVWALGAVAFRLRTGQIPFPTPGRLYAYAHDQRLFPIKPLGTSSAFCMNFVEQTLHNDPTRRSTIDKVLTHPWFAWPSASESGMVFKSSTTNESTYSLSPSKTWSSTYNSTNDSHLRSFSYPTPITEPDQALKTQRVSFPASSSRAPTQEYAPDSELMTHQTKVKAKDIVLYLKLTIFGAYNLEKKDFFRSPDPVVMIYIDGRPTESTSVKKRTRNPDWSESFNIEINENSILGFRVYDNRNLLKEDGGILGDLDLRPGNLGISQNYKRFSRFIGTSNNSQLHLSIFTFDLCRNLDVDSSLQDLSLPEPNVRKDKARLSSNHPGPTQMLDVSAAGKCSKVSPELMQFNLNSTFGVSLELLYARDGTVVPFLLRQCFDAIENFGLNLEGIYHLAGITHVNRLKNAFETDASEVDFSNPANFSHDVYSVASLVKLFFRELPDPLIPMTQYSQFFNAARVDNDYERLRAIRGHINVLPNAHYAVSRALFLHLKKVQEHSAQNDMSIRNLAVCFGSILMRGKDTHFQIRVVTTILKNVLQIFDDE